MESEEDIYFIKEIMFILAIDEYLTHECQVNIQLICSKHVVFFRQLYIESLEMKQNVALE